MRIVYVLQTNTITDFRSATLNVVNDALTTAGQDAPMAIDIKGPTVQSTGPSHPESYEIEMSSPGMYPNGHVIPTEEELASLRRVAGSMPVSAYVLCAVEFAERASYYGCNQVFKNFIRGKLPAGGNGAGAPARGTQDTAGALGKGGVIASAMVDAFKFMAYGKTCYPE